jgi:hypothetical protein
MKISRTCKQQELNWHTLPELILRLVNLGINIKQTNATLHSFPDSIGYESLEEVTKSIKDGFHPTRYSIHLSGEQDGKNVCVSIMGKFYDDGDPLIQLEIDGSNDRKTLDSIADFLGLTHEEPYATANPEPRTCFIAHRFDDLGSECADKLARFLELLGFKVVTGRSYSTKSVSAKVGNRINSQALLIVVFTAGEDSTWLYEESIFAHAKEKPIFILKDMKANFKSALFGDLEYISFESPRIEIGFIPILEGLRELGYSLS